MKYPEHPLKLKNTLSGSKLPFVPLQKRTVKLFTCGPSLYAAPHIGNYRTFLYEDILDRYLEYLGYSVERLINFTDVEDKAIEKAGKNRQKLCTITEEAAESFHRNCGLLHIRIPDFIPRSSTSVDQAVHLITKLLDKGIAYRLGPDIFYNPLKFEGFGKLFGLDMSKWPKTKRHYRRDTYRGSRWNLGDFILWHGHRPDRDGDIFWETELGKGRPAWNIQDPAMITKHLGFRIDIACGGVDNLYRHHDYNIAVIEAVSGEQFATFWLHGEHVLLDGKKISKSKGNIVYPDEILSKGIRAATLRYSLITVHYRKNLNLTDDFLSKKENEFHRLSTLTRQFTGALPDRGAENNTAEEHIDGLTSDFEEAMNDDLQVASACEALRNRLEELSRLRTAKDLSKGQWDRIQEKLRRIDSVLQILFE